MKGKYITALVFASVLSTTSVVAYSSFGSTLFSALVLDKNGKVSTQSASLIGALNTEGYTYSDSGYVTSIHNDKGEERDYSVLALTDDGAACIGDCEQEETQEVVATEVTTALSNDQEANAQEALAEEQELKSETASSSEAATSSELIREQSIDTEEDTVIETETEETNDTREEPVSRSGRSRRSSDGTDTESNSETNMESETASNTASGTESDMSGDEVLADTSSSSEVIDTDPEASPIEQFLSALEKVVTVFEGKIGINTLIPRFSLDISGFVYASKGFLIGEPEQPTGLVVTERGICIGACGIDLPSNARATRDANENSLGDNSEEAAIDETEEYQNQNIVSQTSNATVSASTVSTSNNELLNSESNSISTNTISSIATTTDQVTDDTSETTESLEMSESITDVETPANATTETTINTDTREATSTVEVVPEPDTHASSSSAESSNK